MGQQIKRNQVRLCQELQEIFVKFQDLQCFYYNLYYILNSQSINSNNIISNRKLAVNTLKEEVTYVSIFKPVQQEDDITISDHQNSVLQLSLNETESKLNSCDVDDLILIMGKAKNDGWSVIQKIETVEALGVRLCFINHDMFSYQPIDGSLQLYKLKNEQSGFTLFKTIEFNQNVGYENLQFAQKYIKSKQILISKHKDYLKIIRRINHDEFMVDQCIEFKENINYCTISDDGEFFITWDSSSKEIKVRKYNEVMQ